VKDENKQSLTESFYQKLLKVLVVAFDIDCKWDCDGDGNPNETTIQ